LYGFVVGIGLFLGVSLIDVFVGFVFVVLVLIVLVVYEVFDGLC